MDIFNIISFGSEETWHLEPVHGDGRALCELDNRRPGIVLTHCPIPDLAVYEAPVVLLLSTITGHHLCSSCLAIADARDTIDAGDEYLHYELEAYHSG